MTIYARALTPDTTSNIAGGQWSPFGHYRDDMVTAEWRAQFAAALDYSWRRFQIMVGDDYGIRWLPTYTETGGGPPAPSPLDAYHPALRRLARHEHPFPLERITRFDTMYVETGRFLRQLTRDVQLAGGAIRVRDFATPAELAALPERLIFNCTGLGSRALFGDTGLEPVRGQLAILLPQPEVLLCLHRRGRLHVPARRRHHPRRHLRARHLGGGAGARGDRRHRRIAPAAVRRLSLHRLNRAGAPPSSKR